MASSTPIQSDAAKAAPAEQAPSAKSIAPDRVKAGAPAPRRNVRLAWLVLVGLLLLALPALLFDVQQPAVWTEREAKSIAIASETLQRKTPMAEVETSLDDWTPVYQGVTRWDLPPGGVWLQQVMYLGVSPDEQQAVDSIATLSENPQAIVTRSRLGSVLMALLFVAGVYWAGHSIGGTLTAAISALVGMTLPLVVGLGRVATPEIAALAWSTLSIAAALWAMRPLRSSPALWRQLIGWVVSGIGLGLAILTAGPTIAAPTALCTLAIAMVCPRRVGHVMGMLSSFAIATLLITPWALHVHDHNPDIWRLWLNQFNPIDTQTPWLAMLQRAGIRLGLAAAAAGLWVIWLIPALIQPFSSSTGSARRKMLLGWVWLIVAATLLALRPQGDLVGGLLLVLAPLAVAIGLVTQQFHDRAAEGRYARLWGLGRWVACAAALILSLALPALGYTINHHPDLVGWLAQTDPALLQDTHLSYYASAAAALLLTTVLATRFAAAHHPAQTIAALACWLIIAYAMAAFPIARGPLMSKPAQPPPAALPLNPAATSFSP